MVFLIQSFTSTYQVIGYEWLDGVKLHLEILINAKLTQTALTFYCCQLSNSFTHHFSSSLTSDTLPPESGATINRVPPDDGATLKRLLCVPKCSLNETCIENLTT